MDAVGDVPFGSFTHAMRLMLLLGLGMDFGVRCQRFGGESDSREEVESKLSSRLLGRRTRADSAEDKITVR